MNPAHRTWVVTWEEKLRQAEAVEHAYQTWRREQAGPVGDGERADLLALAQDLPRVWRSAPADERKRILRLIVREVVLDQKREPGMVWMRICWQTSATSEHRVQRHVHSYADCASADQLMRRVREMNATGKMDGEIATVLNAENIMSARGVPFSNKTVYLLRKQHGIRTVKINGVETNPSRWPDGSYSVQGLADLLGVTKQTVFDWLQKGRLSGRQLAAGQPWQIPLSRKQIATLRSEVRRTNRSKEEAS